MDFADGIKLAAFVAVAIFALFFIKHVMVEASTRRATKRHADGLIIALYAEIKANTDDLDDFLTLSPPVDRVKQAVAANPTLRPHVVNTSHTRVYESHVDELSSLPQAVILKVVTFYCEVERLRALLQGINRPSYEQISGEGRAQLIDELWRIIERGRRLGHEVLHGLEVHAPVELTREAAKAK